MKNMSMAKKNNVLSLVTFTLAILLLCSFIFAPTDVAQADWQESYTEYLNSLPSTDSGGDWYFGEDYLNLDGALELVNNFLSDKYFDSATLKADPIVIAVIDSGIGHAYKVDGSTEVSVSPVDVYKSGVSYKLHEIFDDVLLTDKDGDYIYKNFADTVKIDTNLIDKTIDAVTDSGDIAKDLVDNTSNDHGTHVTGTVALLIHALGLEDYVKILPIKANTTLSNKNSGEYLASYNSAVIEKAIEFAYEHGADIVSLSLTANANNAVSYDFERANDMVVVAAAGNQGKNVAGYPAAHSNVLGVMNYKMSSAGKAVLADSSNYGSWYEISAPGTGIISSINGDDYGALNGTSMATPITAFATALAYFRFRGYNNYDFDFELTPDIIRAMIPYGAKYGSQSFLDDKDYPMLNLTDILACDFYGNEDFISTVVDPVEDVEILTGVAEYYFLGKDNEVSLSAVPTISSMQYKYDVKWWYIHDGEEYCFAEGWCAEFEVPNYVGDYQIVCVVYDKQGNEYMVVDEEVAFSVRYQQIENLDIIVTENSTYNYTYTLSTEYLDPEINVETIEWYVNGRLAHTGDKFDLSFEDDQYDTPYMITVKVNGQDVNDYKVIEPDDSYGEIVFWLLLAYAVLMLLPAIGLEATSGVWVAIAVYAVAYAVLGVIVLSIYYAVRKKKEQK